MKTCVYARVSTREQTEGFGLDVQINRCLADIKRREWDAPLVLREHISTRIKQHSMLLSGAMEYCAATGSALVVAKIDRLGRDIVPICEAMTHAQVNDYPLVVLQPAVDTTSMWGRAMVQMAAIFAEIEREIIRERVWSGLKEAQRAGVHTGRPVTHPPELVDEIVRLHDIEGLVSWQKVARRLDMDGVFKPVHGGKWDGTSLRRMYMKRMGVPQPRQVRAEAEFARMMRQNNGVGS